MAHTGSTQWIYKLPKATTKTIDTRHAASHQSVSRPKRHPQTLDNAPVQERLYPAADCSDNVCEHLREPGSFHRAQGRPLLPPHHLGSPFHQSG